VTPQLNVFVLKKQHKKTSYFDVNNNAIVKRHFTAFSIVGLSGTQRQARELISGPSPAAKTGLCPLIGHNPGLLLAFLLDIIP